MPIPARLAIVGDYDSTMYTHLAIDEALGHVRELREHALEWSWVATPTLATNASARLALIDAIWLAPASPYASTEGALAAIRHARETGLPFLGVCGGFQHAVLEFARNVAGIADAEHAELNPGAATAVIAPLTCSLVGKAAPVFLDPTCRTASIYGRWRVVEKYHCNYGLNAEHRDAPLRVPQPHNIVLDDQTAVGLGGVQVNGGDMDLGPGRLHRHAVVDRPRLPARWRRGPRSLRSSPARWCGASRAPSG